MAMCTLAGWVHAWWMSACLVDECMLDDHVHSWWMGACLVDECMFGG